MKISNTMNRKKTKAIKLESQAAITLHYQEWKRRTNRKEMRVLPKQLCAELHPKSFS